MLQRHLVSLFLIGLLSLSGGGAHAAVVGWGAATSNSTASNCPLACSTLNNGDFAFASDGGEGQTSAASSEDTYGFSDAEAVLSDTSFLPTLRALGSSLAGQGAFANATGVQGYTYTGPAQTITLDINLSATLDESAGSSARAEAAAQVAVIFASELAFFTDFGTAVFEAAPPGSVRGTSQLFKSTGLDLTSDSIVFDVVPGDEFLVWAGLQAEAWRGGIANAFSTLTLQFLDAQNQLLDLGAGAASVAAVNPVPLPAGAWLFLTGIGALAGFTRRRKKSQ